MPDVAGGEQTSSSSSPKKRNISHSGAAASAGGQRHRAERTRSAGARTLRRRHWTDRSKMEGEDEDEVQVLWEVVVCITQIIVPYGRLLLRFAPPGQTSTSSSATNWSEPCWRVGGGSVDATAIAGISPILHSAKAWGVVGARFYSEERTRTRSSGILNL